MKFEEVLWENRKSFDFMTGKRRFAQENADFPPQKKTKMEDDGGKLMAKKWNLAVKIRF